MANLIKIRLLVALVGLVGVMALVACQSSPAASVAATPETSEVLSSTSPVDSPEFPEVVPLDEPLVAPEGVPEELATVWEVWNLLTREHVERSNFDPDVFTEAAIRGMLQALGDPHTNYISPEAFNIENEDLQGKFEGIGANVSMTQDGRLVIVAPLQGSPAELAGLRPGDIILEVDGESIAGDSLLGAVAKIRGPRGSEVVLLIQHIGDIDPVEIAVRRGVIPLESVLLRSEPGERIAHIRITNFFADTAEVLSDTIQQAEADGAEGLIIDVRDNPGGLLRSVVDIVNLFLDEDDLRHLFGNNSDVPKEMKDPPVILYEVDGNGRQSNWRVGKGGVATDIPMVILANDFSASASEILVGALQDYDRATFVGGTTFGKGSVNVLRPLGNGGGLFLTFAHWFTPSGRLIQGNGLEPDVEVVSRDPRTAEVSQLEKAVEILEAQLNESARAN